MATVIIAARATAPNARLVKDLRELVPGGVASISAALIDGHPLFEGELFDRPGAETFSTIRKLLSVLEAHGLQPLVWEAGYPVGPQVLRNIMSASERSAREFDRLAGFGHEA